MLVKMVTISIIGYWLYFFFLLYAVAPNSPVPETNSKVIHSIILLLSPVCGLVVSPPFLSGSCGVVPPV